MLVHGICHGGWCWEQTRLDLEKLGHAVSTPDLPLTSLADDANAVKKLLDSMDGPSVLVGHSYGGTVISIAANGRSDVAHLVYVAAIMIGENENFSELLKAHPSDLSSHMVFADDNTFSVGGEGAHELFYHCCDPATQASAVSRLRSASIECLMPQPVAEPWKTVPSTYVLCAKDRAIAPALQQIMSKKADHTVVIDTDHSPFYSSQDELRAILCGVAEEC